MVAASLLAGVLFELFNVGRMCERIDSQINCKRAETETKAGKDVACKKAMREDGVLAPCFALSPRITVELWHLDGVRV